MTPQKSIEEIVQEGKELVEKYIDDVSRTFKGLNSNVKNGEFTNWLRTTLLAERQQVKETIKKIYQSAKEDHFCRFNDGKQNCDCYYDALNDLLAELN